MASQVLEFKSKSSSLLGADVFRSFMFAAPRLDATHHRDAIVADEHVLERGVVGVAGLADLGEIFEDVFVTKLE